MADRVEVAAGGQNIAEVQVGDKGFLALPHRPGENLTAGRHDDRVAFFEPVAVLLAVLIRDQPVTVREAPRDLAGVQDRVDADHEHPVLPGAMAPTHPSRGAKGAPSHRSTPCAYMWNLASGM